MTADMCAGASLAIGSLTLSGGMILAPMAGITAWPMRMLCREMGACFAVTEMVSVKSIVHSPEMPALLSLMDRGDETGPLALQLFGAEGQDFASAIHVLSDSGRLNAFDAIDINMGCPAPKVTRSGAGGALLEDINRASDIVGATVQALAAHGHSIPVMVKTRLGQHAGHHTAVELARAIEDAGASAITIHGRTCRMMYSGSVSLDGIASVKAAVSIPVIGNGDIASVDCAITMMDYTHCDAVMIGRAAIGHPWVFNPSSVTPSIEDRMRLALRHAHMHCAWHGENHGMIELRSQLGWYMRGMPGASAWRTAAHRVTSIRQLEDLSYSVRLADRQVV